MTALTRNAFLSLLAAVALGTMGCPANTTHPDGGGGAGGSGDCVEDTDCPDPQYFFCNTTTSKCEPSCRTKNDCNAGRPSQYALDYCLATSRGCECDEGSCVASLCSADVDCGSASACRSGQCVSPPAASAVASCQITPDAVMLKVGAKATFYVAAWDAAQNPIIVKDGATWSAVDTSVTIGGTTTGNSAEFTGATTTSGTASVTAVKASFGTVNCTGKVWVLPAPTGTDIGVVVYDELSNRPVVGADVMLSNSTTGASIATGTTDGRGYAAMSPGAATTVTVSAFKADYSYLSVANYSSSSADKNFLALPLRRNQTDKYGGYKGTFTGVPATSNVHAAIAGMSLAGSITNLSIAQLLGPSVPTDIVIGSAINQTGVPIPAGAFLGFGDQHIKDTISGQGLAGTCVDGAGNPDETKIGAGTCGTRSAWALAGDIPLGDLPINAFAGGTSNINVSQLLTSIVPIFKKFNSSVTRDVQFDLHDTPCKSGGTAPCSDPDFSSTSFFVSKDQNFTQIPLAMAFAAKLPDLPTFGGAASYADGALMLGGAIAPGRGVIPLGIGVGVNTAPNDAQVDALKDASGNVILPAGKVSMRMAPTHHGLEGDTYGIIAAALSAKSITSASAGLALSATFSRLPGNKLVFDPSGATPIDLSGEAFPPFPLTARYNYATVAQNGLNPRQFKFVTAPGAGVSIIRVSFGDAFDHHWDVLMDAADATAGFVLPTPPGALLDRTYPNGLTTSGRSTMLVQAFRLSADPTVASSPAVDFNGLVEFNGTNGERVTEMLRAFSLVEYAAPTVAFKTPNTSPATVAHASKLVVHVTNFQIGPNVTDDGVVKFSFTSGGNPVSACPDATVTAEATAGSGDVEYTLPGTCGPATVDVKAQLMLPNGTTAVLPEVSTAATLTVQ